MNKINIIGLLFLSVFVIACNKAINYNDPQGPIYQGSYSNNSADDNKLRVITLNTNHSNQLGQIIKLLQQSEKLNDADIILLQETDQEFTLKIAQELKYDYAYIPSAIHPQTKNNFGNAILSKWEIVETDKIILPETAKYNGLQRSVVKSLINYQGTMIQIYNIHFETIFQLSPEKRFKQADYIFNDALKGQFPTIIAGDFNSKDIAEMGLSYGFEWLTSDIGNTTYLFSWDHVLARGFNPQTKYSAGVVSNNYKSSDHKPVWVEISLSNPNNVPNGTLNNKKTENTTDSYKKPVASLGQPMRLKPYVGMSMVIDRQNNNTKIGGVGYFGLYRDLLHPVSGLLGVAGEVYVGGTSKSELVGFRFLASSPVIHLHTGLDYDVAKNKPDLIVSATPPLRRGGLLGAGDFLRIDWIPTRSHTLLFGLQIPLFQKTGITRPKDRKISLPKPKAKLLESKDFLKDPEIAKKFEIIRDAAILMAEYNTFYEDTSVSFEESLTKLYESIDQVIEIVQTKSDIYPEGKSFKALQTVYHKYIDDIFREAVNSEDENMDKLLVSIRNILLEEVIIPYDRTIGQIKKNDTVLGFGKNASKKLVSWMDDNMSMDKADKIITVNLFIKLIEIIDDCRKYLLEQYNGDSRQVWLLFQYALLPSDHDTQEELDNLIKRTLGYDFTEKNAVDVLDSHDFIWQLKRTIEETQDYHVLWVHDYRGTDSFGNPDRIGFDLTVNSYLKVLTERVKEYDKTRKMPVFIIIVDQFFYEIQDGRIWLSLLENPLEENVKLPKGYEYMESQIKISQQNLRDAIRNSKILTQQSDQFGEQYIKNKVKVHINITQPPDFSFLSPGIVNWVPFLPDNIMIDHRKLVFYDLTKQNPYNGEAIITGTGIGEHYASPTWDDRALLVSGPAIFPLKKMARDVLTKNGLKETEVPEVLLDDYELSDSYDSNYYDLHKAADAKTLIVENSIGYGDKYSTLLFSVLYSLAPPDTIMVLPDSLWLSRYWASLVIGAAARGCHVYVIAPSYKNAPSPGSVQMWRSKVIISTLLAIQKRAEEVIEMSGGSLRVGIYDRESDVGDITHIIRETVESFRENSFLLEEFPVNKASFKIMSQIADQLDEEGYKPIAPIDDVKQRLVNMHRKTRFLASKEILSTIANSAISEEVLWQELDLYIRSAYQANSGNVFENDTMEIMYPMIDDYYSNRHKSAINNGVLYFSIGSHNHDPRGLALDGEISYLISGPWALWGYIDSIFLLGQIDWINSYEDLEKYLPGKNEWKRKMGYWIRNLL